MLLSIRFLIPSRISSALLLLIFGTALHILAHLFSQRTSESTYVCEKIMLILHSLDEHWMFIDYMYRLIYINRLLGNLWIRFLIFNPGLGYSLSFTFCCVLQYNFKVIFLCIVYMLCKAYVILSMSVILINTIFCVITFSSRCLCLNYLFYSNFVFTKLQNSVIDFKSAFTWFFYIYSPYGPASHSYLNLKSITYLWVFQYICNIGFFVF